jgi:hypothetical protein
MQSSPPFKFCPACGQKLALHMQQCGRCKVQQPLVQATSPQTQSEGFTLPSNQPPSGYVSLPSSMSAPPKTVTMPAQPSVPIPTMPLIVPCVNCGNPDVQKVTALYQSGSWTSSASSLSVGGGHVWGGPNFTTVGTTSTKGKGATGIAALLAPPVCPRVPVSLGGVPVALGCLMPLGGGALMAALGSLAEPSIMTIFLLGTATLSIGMGIRIFQDVQQQKPARDIEQQRLDAQWRQAMQRWETLIYCPRCDSVYQPHTRQSAPSHQIHRLIGY